MLAVFYDKELIMQFFEYSKYNLWTRSMCHGDYKVYSHAYVYDRYVHRWYRIDGPPLPSDQVPKELQLLRVLLN